MPLAILQLRTSKYSRTTRLGSSSLHSSEAWHLVSLAPHILVHLKAQVFVTPLVRSMALGVPHTAHVGALSLASLGQSAPKMCGLATSKTDDSSVCLSATQTVFKLGKLLLLAAESVHSVSPSFALPLVAGAHQVTDWRAITRAYAVLHPQHRNRMGTHREKLRLEPCSSDHHESGCETTK